MNTEKLDVVKTPHGEFICLNVLGSNIDYTIPRGKSAWSPNLNLMEDIEELVSKHIFDIFEENDFEVEKFNTYAYNFKVPQGKVKDILSKDSLNKFNNYFREQTKNVHFIGEKPGWATDEKESLNYVKNIIGKELWFKFIAKQGSNFLDYPEEYVMEAHRKNNKIVLANHCGASQCQKGPYEINIYNIVSSKEKIKYLYSIDELEVKKSTPLVGCGVVDFYKNLESIIK